MKEIGIYMIVNVANGKRYIGSTIRSFKQRFNEHKMSLHKGVHKNHYLQRAWNKYTYKMFKFVILESVNKVEDIPKREQWWINQCNSNELYNINLDAVNGTNFSPEVIEKRRQTMLRKYSSGELISAMKGKVPWNKNKKTGHEPWNKGKKYISTDHLKVPKLNKGNRAKDKLTKRTNAPEIEIYTIDNQYLGTWRSAKDIEDWSITQANDLPINSRFKTSRMNKPINLLQSANINKSCKTGKSYKGLIFKFSAPCNSNVTSGVGEFRKSLSLKRYGNPEPSSETKESEKVQRLTGDTIL